MSGLWTPDGAGADPDRDDAAPDDEGFDVGFDDGSSEAALAEARRRLAEVPPEVVVVNHAMGLYELAAIHLSAAPPNLAGAALAIDAFACLVEGSADRLGPEVTTLQNALSQIRLAFVQIKGTLAER